MTDLLLLQWMPVVVLLPLDKDAIRQRLLSERQSQ
jgi:hypothetical protein